MATSNMVAEIRRSCCLFQFIRATNKSRLSLLGFRGHSTSIVKHARGGRYRQVDRANQIGRTKIQDSSFDDAIQLVKEKVSEFRIRKTEVNLFLGTGQYFHNPKRDRVLVLNAKSGFDNFDTATVSKDMHFIEPLLDCSLPSSDVDRFSDELLKLSKSVCNGEVNAVDNGPWKYGFVLCDHFKTFSRTALQCNLGTASLGYATGGKLEQIPIHEITSVSVELSEEPWNDQTISVSCRNGTTIPLLTFGYTNDYRDLAMLMMDTEWSVKAAALLCLRLRKLGNNTVHLKLPKVLTIQGNPWVETRHDLWTKFLT